MAAALWIVLLGGCGGRVVSGAEVVGADGCVTWDPIRERGPIRGAWILGDPAALEVSWAWLEMPERSREWLVDVSVDGGDLSTISVETDRQGTVSMPLEATESWSAGFRRPSEPNSDHFATMRAVGPDETTILCVGHREPTGEQRELRRGGTETVEVLTHLADGLDVEISVVGRTIVLVFDDRRSGLAQGVVPVVDGRAELEWEVPGPFEPGWDILEAHVRLVGPDGPLGDFQTFELSQ